MGQKITDDDALRELDSIAGRTADKIDADRLYEARAHLAARLAALEQQVKLSLSLADSSASVAEIAQSRADKADARATRAEAELAAALAFLRDDATAISYQSLGQYRKAALDAARGAG